MASNALGGKMFFGTVEISMPRGQVRNMVAALDRMRNSLRDFREPLGKSMNRVFVPHVKKTFKSQGFPKWAALSPKTVLMRQERRGWYKKAPSGAGDTGPVLRWTGNLAAAAAGEGAWGTPPKIEKNMAKLVLEDRGPRTPGNYGKKHDAGAAWMPRRQFYNIEQVGNEIEDVFMHYLDEKIKW